MTKQIEKQGLFRLLWLKFPAFLSPLKVATLLIVGILIAACSDEQGEKKEIVFGLGPSIYVNQVEGGIIPYLEKKGYQVSIKMFSQNSMIDRKSTRLNSSHVSISYA